jgi:hypothetical protein
MLVALRPITESSLIEPTAGFGLLRSLMRSRQVAAVEFFAFFALTNVPGAKPGQLTRAAEFSDAESVIEKGVSIIAC